MTSNRSLACLQSSGTNRFEDGAGFRSFHSDNQLDSAHYSSRDVQRNVAELQAMEYGDRVFLERREIDVQDELAKLIGGAREKSRDAWVSESAQPFAEPSKYSENWNRLGAVTRGDKDSRERELGFRHEREDAARKRDKIYTQEQLRKELDDDLRQQMRSNEEARRREEEARRYETRVREREEVERRKERRLREEERRREEENHREEERRKMEERCKMEERSKMEERRKIEERQREEEKRKAKEKSREEERHREEERLQRDAEIALLLEAQKREAAKIAELVNKLDDLKASRLALQKKRKDDVEDLRKERQKLRERIRKDEEKAAERMREFEAAQEKLDIEFSAKQDKMAEQWKKLLQATGDGKSSEKAQDGKKSENPNAVKPLDGKLHGNITFGASAKTSFSKSVGKTSESSQSKIRGTSSRKGDAHAERSNKLIPSKSGQSSTASRSTSSIDTAPPKAGKAVAEQKAGSSSIGTSKATSTSSGVDERGSKGKRKVIQLKKPIKVKESEGKDTSSHSPSTKKEPVKKIQSIYSNKMDVIAASLSEFARVAKEKHQQQSTTAHSIDAEYGSDISASDFVIDTNYSGSGSCQAEKKHQETRNKDNTKSPRLMLENKSRKRSGSSQNFPLPNPSRRKQLGAGEQTEATESEDGRKRGGDRSTEPSQRESSHRINPSHKQAPLNVKKVKEEERRNSHGEGRRQGCEGEGRQQNPSTDQRREKGRLSPITAPSSSTSYHESIMAQLRWTQKELAGERPHTSFRSLDTLGGHGLAFTPPTSEEWLGQDRDDAAGRSNVSAVPYSLKPQQGVSGNYLEL